MKKYIILITMLAVLAGCGPIHYAYNGNNNRDLSVRERLDRRSYSLNIEREIRHNPGAASRTGRMVTNDVRDFVISVQGDRFYNMRDPNTEYRIANYRDKRTSQGRTVSFWNYYRRGNSMEGKYEICIYNDGYFRLVVRNRNNSIRHEYEGWMIRDYELPGYHRYPRR